MNGYDFDGVISTGIRPESRHDVIITGRSYEESAETYSYLIKNGIFNAVYFLPVKFDDKHPDKSAYWKASMILQLGVDVFYEDEDRQAKIIAENCGVEIRMVINGS